MLARYSFALYVTYTYSKGWLCVPKHKYGYINLQALSFDVYPCPQAQVWVDYGYTLYSLFYLPSTHMVNVDSFHLISCYGKCNPYPSTFLSGSIVTFLWTTGILTPHHAYIYSPHRYPTLVYGVGVSWLIYATPPHLFRYINIIGRIYQSIRVYMCIFCHLNTINIPKSQCAPHRNISLSK